MLYVSIGVMFWLINAKERLKSKNKNKNERSWLLGFICTWWDHKRKKKFMAHGNWGVRVIWEKKNKKNIESGLVGLEELEAYHIC